jgi:hypothetical protein
MDHVSRYFLLSQSCCFRVADDFSIKGRGGRLVGEATHCAVTYVAERRVLVT